MIGKLMGTDLHSQLKKFFYQVKYDDYRHSILKALGHLLINVSKDESSA